MIEIERKFLLKPGVDWKPETEGTTIKQGYLSIDPERVIRVRIAGSHAFLTIKGKVSGISRTEMEYEIPIPDAEVLLKLCLNSVVEKTRYKIDAGDLVWEVDVFEGDNKGLIMAEIELQNENQEFEKPAWIGEEVSFDKRYFNSYLSQTPYSKWD